MSEIDLILIKKILLRKGRYKYDILKNIFSQKELSTFDIRYLFEITKKILKISDKDISYKDFYNGIVRLRNRKNDTALNPELEKEMKMTEIDATKEGAEKEFDWLSHLPPSAASAKTPFNLDDFSARKIREREENIKKN